MLLDLLSLSGLGYVPCTYPADQAQLFGKVYDRARNHLGVGATMTYAMARKQQQTKLMTRCVGSPGI